MTLSPQALKDKRTCRIFFSSPFGGMEDEREELTRQYFPRIQHICSSRGIQFVAVDMRWGITSEASSSAQVINICLRELDRSDMFVGFFGQRYGWHGVDDKSLQENFDNAIVNYPWLDKYRDKSVTELEYLHGHLNNPGHLPAVICFRDKAYDDKQREDGIQTGDKKKVYKYSAESELSTQLMDDLKRRVQESEEKATIKLYIVVVNFVDDESHRAVTCLRKLHHVKLYLVYFFMATPPGMELISNVMTLGIHMNYKTPAEGAELMFNAIWKHLTEVLLKDTKVESKLSRILSEHNAFLSSRSLLYVGNKDNLQMLTNNIKSEKAVHYVITGPAGSGKSSLLCNWIKQLRSDSVNSDVCVIYHFVGAAEESANIRSMLVQLIAELERHGDDKTTNVEKKNLSDLVNQLIVCFEKLISLKKTPVLVVDGIDKFKKSTKVEKPMYWLPTILPPGVRVVVSTKSSDKDNMKELIEERKFTQIEVLPLNLADQKEMSEKTLLQSGKELSPHQLERIVEAEETKNPLYLKIILNELVVFGYFRLLDKKIDSLISSENVIELFDKVLQRLEDDYNVKEYTDNLIEQTMCAICLSNNGLLETDIKDVYKIPAHIWSPLYFALQPFIIEQNGLIRFAFTELEEAISDRYMKSKSKREQYITDLIQYFENEKQINLLHTQCVGTRLCMRSCLLRELTTSQLVAIATCSDPGSHNRLDLIQSLVPPHYRLPVVFDEDPVLENRLSHELPWLYLKLEDIEGLQRTLMHLTVCHVLKRDCVYDLIELWNKTGTKWNDIAQLYMKQIDLLLVDYHQWIQDNFLEREKHPPIMLLDSGILKDLEDLIVNVSPFSAILFTERYSKITLHCIDAYPKWFQEKQKYDVLYHLACQYCEAGKLEKSEVTHLQVLEAREKRFEEHKTKEDTKELGMSYHGLGVVYLHLRQYEKAESYFLRSKELEEKFPEILNQENKYALLQNLGVICINTGRYDEALDYSLQTMKILEEIYFGHLPESIGQLLTNIGLCYRKLMKLDEAEKIYKQSIDIKVNAVGYNTVDVALTLINLGTLENVRENPDKSLEYYEEAIRIYEIVGIEESELEYMMAKENVIIALISLKRTGDALDKYRPWFKIASDNKILYTTITFTHTSMVQHLTDNKCYDEALNIVLTLLETTNKDPGYFVCLHKIAIQNDKDMPDIPQQYSLEKGLELFPNDPYIIEHIVKDIYVPNNEADKLIDLLESRQSVFGADKLYDAANTWFNQNGRGTYELLITMNLSALKFVPENLMFLKNVATSYIRLKKHDAALPHFMTINKLEPDNPQNLFWIAQSSALCGDFEVSKTHCNILKEKFPDNTTLITQVNTILDAIHQAENRTDDTSTEQDQVGEPVDNENVVDSQDKKQEVSEKTDD